MKLPTKHLCKQTGQATMEAVLIIAVIVAVGTKITSVAQSRGFMRQVVEGPWSHVRGMIEDGVWVRHTDSKQMHPNFKLRHQSRRGDST